MAITIQIEICNRLVVNIFDRVIVYQIHAKIEVIYAERVNLIITVSLTLYTISMYTIHGFCICWILAMISIGLTLTGDQCQ